MDYFTASPNSEIVEFIKTFNKETGKTERLCLLYNKDAPCWILSEDEYFLENIGDEGLKPMSKISFLQILPNLSSYLIIGNENLVRHFSI